MCYPKPGPRCSAHAKQALQKAYESKDAEQIKHALDDYRHTPAGIEETRKTNPAYAAELEQERDQMIDDYKATVLEDKGRQEETEFGTVPSLHLISFLKTKGKNELASKYQEERDQKLSAFTQTLSAEELKEKLNIRTHSDEYNDLLRDRDDKVREYQAKWNELKKLQDEHNGFNEPMRIKRREVQEAYTDKLEANSLLEEYKNETAHYAARYSDATESFEEEYQGRTLGNCIPMKQYRSNSREWLIQRQDGIGGSDIGGILKVDNEWGRKNFERIWTQKTIDYSSLPDSAFTPTELNPNRTVKNAMQRGDAWEPLIAHEFKEHNSDLKLVHSKMTWQNKDDPAIRVNVDGLLSSRADGQPDGVLEIKTSARRDNWEHGVPSGYRAQVLYYLEATGFNYAYLAVKIDDQEYRQYRIERGEKINDEIGTIQENMGKIKEFMAKARKEREAQAG